MVKIILPAFVIIAALTSCSSLKPINSANNRGTASPAPAHKSKDIKFLDDISVASPAQQGELVARKGPAANDNKNIPASNTKYAGQSSSVEKASALQLKYAVLLNTEVEMLEGNVLLPHIDEWYGTRYRMGGTTKSGIDCSAFVQAIYLATFAIPLPRTAREQYKTSRIISATELKEGDLVFFNTTGGISHVGIYLQNNKFIHASSSFGVIISDMFEPYYVKRFIGAGRIDKPQASLP